MRRLLPLIGLLLLACGRRPAAPPPGRTPGAEPAPRSVTGPVYDPVPLYQKLGLLAKGGAMPFVGSVAFFGTPTADSTHVLVAISLANASLTFAREDDRFRAGYTVRITLRDGPSVVAQAEAQESVVVTSFRETSRTDESVLFQELLTVRPGRYAFAVAVRDLGSSRGAEENVTLAVPALGSGALATPVSYARVIVRTRLEALPQVVVNPTAGATFGKDSVIPVYLEAYDSAGVDQRVLEYVVRTDDGRRISGDTVSLSRRGGLLSGVLSLPVARIGIGAMRLDVWEPGRADTVRAPLFVGFGAELPVATFDEMLNYLRWFAPPYKLQALRDSAPEARPAAWAAFVAAYASLAGANDALAEYFARLLEANFRFREEAAPGWQTDRGKVFLGLGRPDQIFEQPSRDLSQRGRTQVWEYRSQNLSLVFVDQTGFGRWRFAGSGEMDFLAAWRRRVQ